MRWNNEKVAISLRDFWRHFGLWGLRRIVTVAFFAPCTNILTYYHAVQDHLRLPVLVPTKSPYSPYQDSGSRPDSSWRRYVLWLLSVIRTVYSNMHPSYFIRHPITSFCCVSDPTIIIVVALIVGALMFVAVIICVSVIFGRRRFALFCS